MSNVIKSVEGYTVFCSGINENATEEQIDDLFSEYGDVTNIQINLDRKTGNLKGYALIEYAELEEAQKAIKNLNDYNLLGKKLKVNFAFKEPPQEK